MGLCKNKYFPSLKELHQYIKKYIFLAPKESLLKNTNSNSCSVEDDKGYQRMTHQ